MTPNPKFINPWYVVDLRQSGEEIHKVTIRLPKRINAFFNGVHGGPEGTLQTTVNLLLLSLYERLTKSNITSYNPRSFEQCVLDSAATIAAGANGCERSPAPESQPVCQAVGGDDGRGVASVAPTAPSSDIQSPDLGGRVTGKKNGKRKK